MLRKTVRVLLEYSTVEKIMQGTRDQCSVWIVKKEFGGELQMLFMSLSQVRHLGGFSLALHTIFFFADQKVRGLITVYTETVLSRTGSFESQGIKS